MCQTELISKNMVKLSKRSFSHRLEAVVPNEYRESQLARLNRELDDLYDLIYDDWRTITEEDYRIFGVQFTILLQTLKQLYDTCRKMPKEMGLKEETRKLGLVYSALYELNSDIVNFCIKLPKNQEMKRLMDRLTEVDQKRAAQLN